METANVRYADWRYLGPFFRLDDFWHAGMHIISTDSFLSVRTAAASSKADSQLLLLLNFIASPTCQCLFKCLLHGLDSRNGVNGI